MHANIPQVRKKQKCSYLVVVAHPDDEVLGAGATIHKLASVGVDVSVCILCSKAEARSNRPKSCELQDDLYASAGILGVSCIYAGNFIDSQLNMAPHLEVVKFIENAIKMSGATHIITHHPNDLNNDHQITSSCCQEAARLSMRMTTDIKPVESISYMEVPSSTDWALNSAIGQFEPNYFIEIGESGVEKKIEALSKYRDVMRPFPHPRCAEIIRGLAAYRGGQSGCLYAEAFETVFRRGF